MMKPRVIYAALGFVAVLIIALTIYFISNLSNITLLKSGLLIGASVFGLIIVLLVIGVIVKRMLKGR